MNRISRHISVNTLTNFLFKVAVAIIVLDLLALTFTMLTGHDSVLGLLGILDLDRERGVGMLFQVLLLLLSSILLWKTGDAARQGVAPEGPWRFLSGAFFFLMLDEFNSIHERLMPVMWSIVGDEGIFRFAWIVPYGIAVVVLAIWLLPKILRLPVEPRNYLILAAALYVSGALGMEAVTGWRLDAIGGESARPEFFYEFGTTIEESLEMFGIIFLLRALFGMLRDAYPQIDLTMGP
jgi:hypothetical protein